ncbi:MAG: TonB-dependent receptor [Chitinophagaceae bacterium]
MKQFLGTITALIVTTFLFAQGGKLNVNGVVTDAKTKQPVPNATVNLGNQKVAADEAGLFYFNKIKQGKVLLTVSSIGYEEQKITVEIKEGMGALQISLMPSPFFLQPLEVTALRAGDKAPFTKTNLTKEQIAKQNLGQDLPFLFNQTPSVVVNSDAGNGIGYTGMNIRGTDATRINITLNGIPYNDAESQGTFYVNIPDFASSVQSVQIQRGVGTSSNGTGAFGASVNLQTNEFNPKAYAETYNSYGSFNTWRNTIKAGTGLINNHFTVDARLSRINSDGFIDRASTALQSYYVSAAYTAAKTSVRFNLFSGNEKTYQAWYGVPESILASNRTFNPAGADKPGAPYENETDNYTQKHYQLFINHELSSYWRFNTAFFLTQGAGYYEQYRANARFSSYGLPNVVVGGTTISRTDLIRQLWLDNDFYGQIFSLHYKKANNELTIGGGWSTYVGEHFGKVIWAQTGVPVNHRWYDNPAVKKDANLYVKWQHQLSTRWSLFTDVQYKTVRHTMDGFRNNPDLYVNRSFSFLNPKAGINYYHNGFQAYASFAVAQKEPNRNDFEAGVLTQPQAEKLYNWEIGFDKKRKNYQYGANFYWMGYRNQLVLTGLINDVGAYTRVNVPNSYRMGIELQGGIVINQWLNATGNITLSTSRIKEFTEYIDNWDDGTQVAVKHRNKQISFSPNTVAAATINVKPVQHWEISLLSKYVGRQYLDNTQDKRRSLGDFYVQDIRSTYTIYNKILKEITLVAQINNLFSRKYEPNGYTYAYINSGVLTVDNAFFPQAGTNFMLGVNCKF